MEARKARAIISGHPQLARRNIDFSYAAGVRRNMILPERDSGPELNVKALVLDEHGLAAGIALIGEFENADHVGTLLRRTSAALAARVRLVKRDDRGHGRSRLPFWPPDSLRDTVKKKIPKNLQNMPKSVKKP